jgi:hypothetical protein
MTLYLIARGTNGGCKHTEIMQTVWGFLQVYEFVPHSMFRNAPGKHVNGARLPAAYHLYLVVNRAAEVQTHTGTMQSVQGFLQFMTCTSWYAVPAVGEHTQESCRRYKAFSKISCLTEPPIKHMLLNIHHNWKPTGQSVSSYWCNLGKSQKVVKHGQEATVACVPFSPFLFHSLSLWCFSLSLSLSFPVSLFVSVSWTQEAAGNIHHTGGFASKG